MPRRANAPCLAVALLAGGRGLRFQQADAAAGRPTRHKLLARLTTGDTLVGSATRNLRLALGETAWDRALRIAPFDPGAPQAPELQQTLQVLGWTPLAVWDASAGMGHSIAAAARHVLQTDAIGRCHSLMLALADMPVIRVPTLRRLLQHAVRPDRIVVPVHRRPDAMTAADASPQRGHPVLFGRNHLQALSLLSGDTGARQLLQTHPITTVAVDDPGVLTDIDSPEALDALDRELRRPLRPLPDPSD